jgi:5S rRNA maturation endonuclease (ribonuclease M5)
LSTHQKDRLERIQQIIAKLIEEAAKGKPVVVEGKKDAHALAELGVCGTVLTLKTGGKSFLDATAQIEKSGGREVVLLLDFDRRGIEGTKRLQQNLERLKIKANVKCWIELKALVSRDVHCIEGLPNYLLTIQNKVSII